MKHLLAIALLCAAFLLPARELPVTVVGGRQCYVYDVAKRENIYDVSRALGVSTTQIIRYNPSAADGLRQGMRLYIPCTIVEKAGITPAGTPAKDSSTAAAAPAPKAAQAAAPVSDNGRDVPLHAATAVEETVRPETETPSAIATYRVGKGESLYGISRKHGMTMDELIDLNPTAKYGVKQGDILLVNASATDEVLPREEPEQQQQPGFTEPDYSLAPSEERITRDYVVPIDEAFHDVTPADTLNMAIMLPFMSHATDPGKNSRLFVEFYRGMLLAADAQRSVPGNHVNMYVYDTSASDDTLRAIMRRPEMASMNLIIGPDNESHLRLIADDMMSTTTLYNTFNVRSELYGTNRNVVQANIPHAPMLSKAVDAFVDMYREYTPVFLQRIDGPADKEAFTSLMRQRLDSLAIPYREMNYKNLLSHRDLDTMALDHNYVFVPISGSRAEFAKFSEAIRQFGQSRVDNSVRLFGYPDWIIFRGEYLTRLCELEATIYTRFYVDMKDADTERFASMFASLYGDEMLDAAPVQGILGYDTGMYLIPLLKEYGRDFPDHLGPYTGLQSVMNFVSSPGGGHVNDALLIVTFTPDGSTIKTTLE
ncbi:MAG: LysM peptidoglycan-binding domain-containing protein [Clostridiales bacterium]|nr:LysM peptidoglycan-binding domain-containing protein [Clostridiales bacterium]